MKYLLMTADVRICNSQLHPEIYNYSKSQEKKLSLYKPNLLKNKFKITESSNLKKPYMDSTTLKYSKNMPLKGVTLHFN